MNNFLLQTHSVPYEPSSNVHFLYSVELGALDIKRPLACTTPIQEAALQDACSVSSDQDGHSCHGHSFEIFFLFLSEF